VRFATCAFHRVFDCIQLLEIARDQDDIRAAGPNPRAIALPGPLLTPMMTAVLPCKLCSTFFLQALASMRAPEIECWSDGHNSSRVDVVMGDVVVTLDMIELHGLGNTRLLVQVTQITVQIRIVHDPAYVALEMAVIDGIKAD
jgi:hypothetical protein